MPRPPAPRRIVLLAAGLVVAFAVAVFAGVSFSSSSSVGTLRAGSTAPAWSGQALTGQRLSSATERGRWVVLNFFATWCTDCRQETQALKEFAAAHPPARVAVVSVLVADSASAARRYAAADGVRWPILAAATTATTERYRVQGTGLPETFVIDPTGRLVVGIVGAVTRADLDARVADPRS